VGPVRKGPADKLFLGVDDTLVPRLALPEGFFNPSPVSDIPDRFNSPGFIALVIIKRRGLSPEDGTLTPQHREVGLSYEEISLFMDNAVVSLGYLIRRLEDQIDEDWAPLAVKGERILVVSPSQHLFTRNPGHLLYRAVPCDYPSLPVDGKRGIGKKIDNIGKAPL